MTANYPTEPASAIAQRAIALASAVHQELDILNDDAALWEMMGETAEQKISTVLALAGLALGVAALVGDPAEMLREYGAHVFDLDEMEN